MLFDVQAALAEILGNAPAAQPGEGVTATVTPPDRTVSRAAQPAEAPLTKMLPFARPPEPARHDGENIRHGRSPDGRRRTWTGRIVSLEEWRKLSEWDRHGQDGRLFCGFCCAWVKPGGCEHCSGSPA